MDMMNLLKKSTYIFSVINILLLNVNIYSQEVPHSVNNAGIYNFLDELANIQIIEINSAIKPFSRLFISQCLEEADERFDR